MDITVYPGRLSGSVASIPSKSLAHRMLICAAFADKPTTLLCNEFCDDVEATTECLRCLGASIKRTPLGYHIIPTDKLPTSAVLRCGQSGSTLRFMLPVVGALGVDTVFHMEGRLADRPLAPLIDEMERMGCKITHPTHSTLHCNGSLKSGTYQISGNVSSQFITGLLLGSALLEGPSQIIISDEAESKPYIKMTQHVMALFGAETEYYKVFGKKRFTTPGTLSIEGDWSSAAFFLGANFLSSSLTVTGLDQTSIQGDREILPLIHKLTEYATINASDIPDLVPILTVMAAGNKGACFTGVRRLRLKESDRIATILQMLHTLGIPAEATEDSLTVHPGSFTAGTVDSCGDHRIAMTAAIAATVAQGPVTILDAECVSKSYPGFWDDFRKLGGCYELNIR